MTITTKKTTAYYTPTLGGIVFKKLFARQHKKNESHYFKHRATALTSQCPSQRVSIKMHDVFAILDWSLKTLQNLISAATQHLDSRVDRPFLKRVYDRVVSSLHLIYLTMHLSFFVDFLFQRAFAVIIFNFLLLTFFYIKLFKSAFLNILNMMNKYEMSKFNYNDKPRNVTQGLMKRSSNITKTIISCFKEWNIRSISCKIQMY